MISSDVIEKPGRWRSVVLAAVFVSVLAPVFPLLWIALVEGSQSTQGILGSGFGTAILHSLLIAVVVAALSVVLGMPAGLISALYEFPGRKAFLALFAIPLLVPSFLWAIGLSQLRIHLGLPSDSILSGWTGTTLAFIAPSVSLVLYMTLISTRRLSKGQVESVRLIDGEALLLYYAARAALPAVILTGVLAGILTLSDPGPGQILGFSGVPYEILLSFSALYDFVLAAKQCAALTAVVLLIAIPVAVTIAPNVATGFLGRDIDSAPRLRSQRASIFGPLTLCAILAITMVGPVIGMVQPLLKGFPMVRAFLEVKRTINNTFLYAFSAGMMATVLGLSLAFAVGRESALRRYALIGLFLILSLPPSLTSLGIIKIGTSAPAWADLFLRSRFVVAAALALRFLPIATLLAMRSFGSTSSSQAFAAGIHGVPFSLYLRKVLGPMLLPAATLSCVIVALLATAEVGTVLLLRPPGADSLPVQIFTVMANAPESLVAALCFFYVAGATALLVTGWALTERAKPA